MADATFDWRNLDDGVTAALCGADATDDAAANAALLVERFGSPPTDAIVDQCWDALREQWLLRDPRARRRVVDALTAAAVGDTALPTGATGTDLAYLRTCPPGPQLRTIVHDALLATGTGGAFDLSTKSEPPTWEAFEAALATVLADIAADQPLIVSVRGTGTTSDGHVGSAYYVQIVKSAEGGMRVEAVSNGYLHPDERLGVDAQRHLVELGLQPPTHPPGTEEQDPAGSANYYCDLDAPATAEVAHLLCTALREVYGAETPGFLVFQTFRTDGEPTEPIDLGIPREPLLTNSPTNAAESMLPHPTTVAELSAELDRTLRPAFGGRDVVRDADGDVPIIFGSTTIYVRAFEDPPLIRVYAPLLSDLKISRPLIDKVNELNARYLFGKFVWAGSAVIASLDVPASPFVGTHVLQAIGMIGTVADELDDELQREFGGRNASGAFVEPPATDDEGGGYI